ncbi:cation:proton antiporter [Gluconacetobacter azotocaptans]|uniref:cation:proton antiporter domain-containing protein n=1 Tax=Gluconacetobacter azotocaptans TaxID=142834 RepID=UPI00195967C3|nr:cation:proton antiporter [Gluconacetobacter azotocaptans]MBM9400217.1 cation:proton antiporter [Gluconacetobacter azotocaptans]
MPHDTPLISTIVAGLVLAFVFGALANRLRMPPLVGYLVAGILVGPHTPGFVADQSLAPELAELGVILLMFGVGLHFSLKELLAVRFIAIPGAMAQIGVATVLGWALGVAMGWSSAGGLVFGLAVSVASTVVLLKALQERRLVETERGRIAVGWLIVEDLVTVLALVLIPALASTTGHGGVARDPLVGLMGSVLGFDPGLAGILAVTALKLGAFLAVMLLIGRRGIPWVLHHIAHTGSRELFRLGVLAIALGVAYGAAKLFGASLALGAFFAGTILSESELSQRAAQESLPLRDAFAVLFFVSVGMLFDPRALVENPLPLLGTLAIILVGKSITAFLIVILFRRGAAIALTISASLAQIGEFSFILADMGVTLHLLPEQGRSLLLAGAIISIVLNPMIFALCERVIRPALEARVIRAAIASVVPLVPALLHAETPAPPEPAGEGAYPEGEAAPTELTDHVVVVGYGRVGGIVVAALHESRVPFLVIEDADQSIALLQSRGIEVIVGNAASPDVLALANLPAARSIVVAIPGAFEAGQVVEQARALNPAILIIGRAHSDAETEHLSRLGADTVIMGEREIARGMIDRLRRSAPAILPADVASPSPLADG